MSIAQGSLDKEFIKLLTNTNVKKSFDELVKSKTDMYTGDIKIAIGSDNICNKCFYRNIEEYAEIICSKGIDGRYNFSPFKEVLVPKPPYNTLEEAKKHDKTRTLSISTIQDTIFQNLLAQVLNPFAEKKFHDNIDMHSFAYRKNKSSKLYVEKIRQGINNEYIFVLDGDIQKFFDEIDHTLLIKKLETFFGKENELLQRFLYKFIHVDKIKPGKFYRFLKDKKTAEKRTVGIPQGGVLSGLLANIFLYDFDLFVINTLAPRYKFKYFRYADDFVLMFKKEEEIRIVYEKLKCYLQNEELVLHELGGKTKLINLGVKKEYLDFLGFKISPLNLKIKHDNKVKFVTRLQTTIDKEIEKRINEQKLVAPFNERDYLFIIINCINNKIVGWENTISNDGYCPQCKNLIKKRSWLGYFMMVDDIRIFRNLDTQIRKLIYSDYYLRTGKHLRKKELLCFKWKLISLEKTYYKYKKQEKLLKKKKESYCDCERYYDKQLQKIVTKPKLVESNSKVQYPNSNDTDY